MVGFVSLQVKFNRYTATFHVEFIRLQSDNKFLHHTRGYHDLGRIGDQFHAVDAVGSERLVRSVVANMGTALAICGREFPLAGLNRIAVVGAGKAGAGMASAFERAVGDQGRKEVRRIRDGDGSTQAT